MRGPQENFEKLQRLRNQALMGGGLKRIEAQHARGKLTARERLNLLLDPCSFHEIDMLVTSRTGNQGITEQEIFGEGVVVGYGKIDGRLVYVFSQDFTVFGGSLSEAHAEKICKIMDMALKNGAPIVSLNDSGGARIQEGVVSIDGYAEVALHITLASGVVPQISAVMGPCAGGAAYCPTLTDFVFMVKDTSHMFATGPDIVKVVTHEEISLEELGGAEVHTTITGASHFLSTNDRECLYQVRQLLSYLPSNNLEDSPAKICGDPVDRICDTLDEIIPDNAQKAYDMKTVIREVVDRNTFLEVHEQWALNIVVGFARLHGRSVGIIAQQPGMLAGAIDNNASVKGARFIRFCDCFNIPLITFVDAPGFLPGVVQEYGGLVRHGAKLLYAYAEATVPKVAVITRKAYGGGYGAMGSKFLRGDINYAWPTAEIAVMSIESAVRIIFKDELKHAADPKTKLQELKEQYQAELANPYIAAMRGSIDEIIDPKYTRKKLIAALEMLKNKRDTNPPKKHGNMPL